MILLKKIISGGQTGADQAGLKIAYDFSYLTGGYAPKGYITSDGPNRQLLQKKYGLIEYGEGYIPRTIKNVKSSDATIRMAVDFDSAGEILTLHAINKHKKPYLDIDLNNPIPILRLYNWLLEHNINILNIAGNPEGRCGKNIFKLCYTYLNGLFLIIKEKE